ncbi:zinc ABC transporter substrate-binding protein [Gellertiella hungarica]|uniref:High-affinity zinc uptake system protein ZnuA n=1 Tax=Gellertiella hungarica TaxID=1572859 RepID=A0A7W6J8Z1_9HYPH|nr:zinc transport system substrate-binding protein [Gellertiella hungarica]
MTLSKWFPFAGLAAGVSLSLLGSFPAHGQEAPVVTASVKPLHSLVAAVMQGVGEPKLIVGGSASPHTYSLKPSNAADIESAKVIFWMGADFEHFLEEPMKSLGANAQIVAMQDAPGLTKLPFREGGAFEAHDDGDHAEEAHADHDGAEEAHHDHGEEGAYDLHFWLDPQNAVAMVESIRDTLEKADPAHAEQYRANARAVEANLEALDRELADTLAPIRNKPFVVFHDAYQYFEKRYGLRVAGSITVSPETPPGAERVREIHDKIASLGATCVFAEPQFEPKLVGVVTEGSAARSGTLDPEGGTLAEGPDLYFTLMRTIASSLTECLGKS